MRQGPAEEDQGPHPGRGHRHLSNQITFISILGNGGKDHNFSITIFKFYSNGQCQVRGSARSEAVLNTKF